MFVQISPAEPTSDMASDSILLLLAVLVDIGRHRRFVRRAEGHLDRLALDDLDRLVGVGRLGRDDCDAEYGASGDAAEQRFQALRQGLQRRILLLARLLLRFLGLLLFAASSPRPSSASSSPARSMV